MSERLSSLIKGYVCRGAWVLDVGSGSGRSAGLIINSCGSSAYVVGVDKDFERLLRAKSLLGSCLIDFISCDAARLPIRDESLGASSVILTLHEVEEELVCNVINEVWRVLKRNAAVLFVDKCLFEPLKPSEELAVLTEEAYHKALEYVEGTKLLGLRKPEEYINIFKEHGFTLKVSNVIEGRHVDSEKFLSSWGKDTLKLLEQLSDNMKKTELIGLVNKIRSIGGKYGYGPAKFVVAILIRNQTRK